MAALALALFVLYLALAVGARTALQIRWTGSSGHQRPSRLVEWVGYALFVVTLGLFLAFLGLTLMVPSVVAFVGFLGLVAAVELQVRFVEEPYLVRKHGERYLAYASRVGRFVPGVGKVKARSESSWPS